MAVDAKTVRDIADLARLRVSDSELGTMAEEMATILEFMRTIDAWDGAPEATRTPAKRRPDVPRIETESMLFSNAAHVAGHAVVVPPVKGAS